jgi:hypothetical protein
MSNKAPLNFIFVINGTKGILLPRIENAYFFVVEIAKKV